MILKLRQTQGAAWRVEKFRRPLGSVGRGLTALDRAEAYRIANRRGGFDFGHADLLLISACAQAPTWQGDIDEAFATDIESIML